MSDRTTWLIPVPDTEQGAGVKPDGKARICAPTEAQRMRSKDPHEIRANKNRNAGRARLVRRCNPVADWTNFEQNSFNAYKTAAMKLGIAESKLRKGPMLDFSQEPRPAKK